MKTYLAAAMTGCSYTDVKLKRTDRIKSSSAANENVRVRGHSSYTCDLCDQNDMNEHLKHEFGNKPPSLFDKSVMRTNTKSVLADALSCHSIVCASLQSIPCHRWWTVVIFLELRLQ